MERFTVKIRPVYDGRAIRPNAQQINDKTYNFMLGWVMDDDDPYPGETAWIPRDDTYPKDAPTWIASGDLERHGVGEQK